MRDLGRSIGLHVKTIGRAVVVFCLALSWIIFFGLLITGDPLHGLSVVVLLTVAFIVSVFAYRKAWITILHESKVVFANTWEKIIDSLPPDQSPSQNWFRFGVLAAAVALIMMIIVLMIIFPLGQPLTLPGRF